MNKRKPENWLSGRAKLNALVHVVTYSLMFAMHFAKKQEEMSVRFPSDLNVNSPPFQLCFAVGLCVRVVPIPVNAVHGFPTTQYKKARLPDDFFDSSTSVMVTCSPISCFLITPEPNFSLLH